MIPRTGKVIKDCPKCHGKIIVSELCQYSFDSAVLKSGKLSKRRKKRDYGSMEMMIAACQSCGLYWNAEGFTFDEQGRFVDLTDGNGSEA